MKMYLLNIFLFFGTFRFCTSEKFLAIYTLPTGSHYKLASKLFTEIANRGHEVTFITPFPSKTPVKNLKEIPLETLQGIFTAQSFFDHVDKTPFEKAVSLDNIVFELTNHTITHPAIQELINSNVHYDAVILYYFLNDALLALAHHFKAPVILLASMPLFSSENFLLSHPTSSSYVPNILTEYTGHMNFCQRLKNTFYDFTTILYYNWFMLPKHRELVKKYIPGKPELYDILNKESLTLINSHVSTTEALPMVPNAIEIGGFHIEEPKPLQEDLQKFLDGSTNGVIVFSMGSVLRSANIPKDKRDSLIKAFSKLKENILWKFEDDNPPPLPKNIKTMNWIPQSDVLAHPNVKAFISHGGLLSTMESVYHGVPIIGIPIFGDQKMNIALAAAYEYAIQIRYLELTEEKISNAIEEILNNPKYKDNIKRRSKIMRDRPVKPLENALYWIEYVIRHEGAPHLRYPGMDLNWFQRNLLDVVGFVVVVTLLPLMVVVFILKNISKSDFKQKKD